MSSSDGVLPSRSVCLNHVIDDDLRRDLGLSLTSRDCSFCDRVDLTAPIAMGFDRLISSVMAGVHEKYEQLDMPELGVATQVVIEDICRGVLDPQVTRALQAWSQPASWRLRALLQGGEQGDVVLDPWPAFRDQVAHQRRFTLLADITPHDQSQLAMLYGVSTTLEQLGLIRTLPAGHQVWRGRMRMDAAPPNYVAATIGSTPKHRAAANRLSPAGVSMFYGSADIETAVVEISAHDSRPYAAVAAFELIRPVPVIDLSVTLASPSIFAPNSRSLLHQIEFIRSFAADLSEPVVLDGREHTAYVPTQVLTEYFRWVSPLYVEGIVFRSAQNGGLNYALFTGPEGCVDAGADKPDAMLRLQPCTELVVARALSKAPAEGPRDRSATKPVRKT
ncbi:RES domain-containing protein [Streptomyces sp. NBC_00063]|uniref:RES domain-containing protein n=1 Tax=Streptomyces sp. NBC_00063 TaxID=2975638 RepID=UPI0022553E65|nr:RES domain-containing protein [Streptomyces sp. NBC_00063]MCX5441297.1 RES domain-containing protein [Streptomyces sp. NBC_00063]